MNIKGVEVLSYEEYEGMLHKVVTRYKVVGTTFGFNRFQAGPFQTKGEAEKFAALLTLLRG